MALGAEARRTEAPGDIRERRQLQDIGSLFYERSWSVGTSSNYSIVVQRDPLRLLITASGKDKRRLGDQDFVVVDDSGNLLEIGPQRPSAETLLHVVAVRQPGIGAVLHTHSVWATVLSDLYHERGSLAIEGYEMLKGLGGVTTHEHCQELAIFENTQDIPDLARRVDQRLTAGDPALKHGFLLRRHGLYTWGRDIYEARRHVEVLEFLMEVLGRRLMLESAFRSPTLPGRD